MMERREMISAGVLGAIGMIGAATGIVHIAENHVESTNAKREADIYGNGCDRYTIQPRETFNDIAVRYWRIQGESMPFQAYKEVMENVNIAENPEFKPGKLRAYESVILIPKISEERMANN